jgi:hypothetical protein
MTFFPIAALLSLNRPAFYLPPYMYFRIYTAVSNL